MQCTRLKFQIVITLFEEASGCDTGKRNHRFFKAMDRFKVCVLGNVFLDGVKNVLYF